MTNTPPVDPRLLLFDDWSVRLLSVAGGTLLVLTIAVFVLAWSTRSARTKDGSSWYFRAYSKGCAAVPIAGLSLFLGVGYAAALVMGVSTALSPAEASRTKDALKTTLFLERVAYAWALAIVPMRVDRRRVGRAEVPQQARVGCAVHDRLPVGRTIPGEPRQGVAQGSGQRNLVRASQERRGIHRLDTRAGRCGAFGSHPRGSVPASRGSHGNSQRYQRWWRRGARAARHVDPSRLGRGHGHPGARGFP